MKQTEVDGETGVSMGHFDTTGGCGFVAAAQTQVPGWALSRYGTVDAIVDYGIGTQVAAGEGDPDYETVAGEFEAVGCGVYVTGSNEAWVVLSFR